MPWVPPWLLGCQCWCNEQQCLCALLAGYLQSRWRRQLHVLLVWHLRHHIQRHVVFAMCAR